MKLRYKLALQLILVAVPSFAGLSWFRHDIESRLFRQRVAETLADRLEEKVPPGCINRPWAWKGRMPKPPKWHRGPPPHRGKKSGPGPGRGPERGPGRGPRRGMFAYDAEFNSPNPKAPSIPVDKVEPGPDPRVLTYLTNGPKKQRGYLVRVEGSRDCHYIGVQVPPRPWRPPASPMALLGMLAMVIGVSTLSGLLVSWPVVRRISRLTLAMNNANEDHPQVKTELEAPDELGDMARSFNALGDRIQRKVVSLARRDEVLRGHVANTSHDLAIPLTVIQHRLRRAIDLVPPGSESHPDMVAALEESAYMSSLVRNLNVSTKLEAKDLYFEPIRLDLQEVLRRVESRFIALAKMKDVDFNLATQAEPIWIKADPVLLEQAISNVVQNAVQYAPAKGHVALIAHLRGSEFCVQVIDDGPGIPEAVLDKILNAGVRDVNVRGRNPEGLGLGLSIVRQVAQLHDWSLTLENRSPDKGLDVSFRGSTETASPGGDATA